MYHPYFRGKQYELITLRDRASLIAASGFVPIIEPVKGQLSGLTRALDALFEEGAQAIVIANPAIGDHARNHMPITQLLTETFRDTDQLVIGLMLDEEAELDEIRGLCDLYSDQEVAIIHYGFADGGALAGVVADFPNITTSIFIDERSGGRLYRRHFRGHASRILVSDGFERRRNRDHPDSEFFSDLHITYEDENMTGFGDFLIVGDDYSEGGGPAYTVAIHITYIDDERDDVMDVHHFKSDSQESPQNPAGKFAEALRKLIRELDSADCKIFETTAMQEFRDLHARGHYPGLGYVKKLSMIHHIETLSEYLGRDD
ncbi:sce7725 family protein [Woodsholea maritima]|uniref:sce7725 family protein n=1 Tax=Woodsholea maritima TaxID=240237 RepID=UPI000365C5D0|nr:sce7725 family protein [Woodsholea maritima]